MSRCSVNPKWTLTHSVLLAVWAACGVRMAMGRAPETAPADVPRITDWLVISPGGRYGRSVIHSDAVEAELVRGTWKSPRAGDKLTLPDGSEKTWESAATAEDGWLTHDALSGGYAWAQVEADEPAVMLLEASGHSMVYVNGVPRAGDPYQTGWVSLPVEIRRGHNELLFLCARGKLRAALSKPRAPITLDVRDATLPDGVAGQQQGLLAAVVVVNATSEPAGGLVLRARGSDGAVASANLPTILAASMRKTGFDLPAARITENDTRPVELELARHSGAELNVIDRAEIRLRVRRPEETRKVTFISAIDGSVQYYALNPARPTSGTAGRPALLLTLHGAGVEAIGQADAYAAKSWGHLVAPTNRRPFGFDWEDWGRLDALEVLRLAQASLNTDPRRVYLTGHSMGGHGVWNLGATFPEKFAAIGPSAGWIDFWSYAGATEPENPTPVEQILRRARASSDTLTMAGNFARQGVYILHGAADDNVPVEQARTMREHLSRTGQHFVYHEEPEAGHWWDISDEPGADCVDWAPMFDFFARHVLPDSAVVREVDFTTVNPAVSAWSHWAGIYGQHHALQPSRVKIRFDPQRLRFVGTTENVRVLALRGADIAPGVVITAQLDGQTLPDLTWPADGSGMCLYHGDEGWSTGSEPPPAHKGPHRYGPFKSAFDNRMLFVYGTRGTGRENEWASAKARYDAESFWYRGNGSVEVLADNKFDPEMELDRNVILYGNADTNRAWDSLLSASPVQVTRGRISVGARVLQGDDLACLFIRPRPQSGVALVGVVSGSGTPGLRLTERLPYFLSGAGFPDCVVISGDMLTQGASGVLAAGFFGPDWGVNSGEFAWRDLPAEQEPPCASGTDTRP